MHFEEVHDFLSEGDSKKRIAEKQDAAAKVVGGENIGGAEVDTVNLTVT